MKFFPLLLIIFISFTVQAQLTPDTTLAQVISLPKTVYETVSTSDVSVNYGRPYKGEYRIFGNQHKYGNVWSAGGEKSTTVTFERNVNFAGQNVNAGTYTLFVIPYESQWTIILNTELNHYGVYTYEKHKDKNILSVNVPVTPLISEIEQLTIRFPLASAMIIEWDKAQVTIPIL